MNEDQALVDFHLHTSCSDGAWSRDQLFDEIRARQLEYFSISDHDTMDAYPVAADLESACIAGIEIDTEEFGQTVHVLAYGVKRSGCALMSRLKEQRENRKGRGRLIIERLNGLGINLTFEQVLTLSRVRNSVGRPHIARALVATKHCQTIQHAFDEYLAEGCPAYVGLVRLSTSEAIDLIREANGLAILAHPRRLRNQTHVNEISKLFDGIEAVHPTADPDYERQLMEFADTHGMVTTGGTDFHARPDEAGIGVRFSRSRVKRLLERLAA